MIPERCPRDWFPMNKLYALRCWECEECLTRLGDDGKWMPSGTHTRWLRYYLGIERSDLE